MSNKKRKLKEIRLSNDLLSGRKHMYSVFKITNEMLDSCKISKEDFIQLQVQGINSINIGIPRLNRLFDYKLLQWVHEEIFEKHITRVEVKFRVLKKNEKSKTT